MFLAMLVLLYSKAKHHDGNEDDYVFGCVSNEHWDKDRWDSEGMSSCTWKIRTY